MFNSINTYKRCPYVKFSLLVPSPLLPFILPPYSLRLFAAGAADDDCRCALMHTHTLERKRSRKWGEEEKRHKELRIIIPGHRFIAIIAYSFSTLFAHTRTHTPKLWWSFTWMCVILLLFFHAYSLTIHSLNNFIYLWLAHKINAWKWENMNDKCWCRGKWREAKAKTRKKQQQRQQQPQQQ